MFYKNYHLYSGSGDFKVAIHTNQGTTIALDVFPELSLCSSNCIIYKRRNKFEEIMQNGGVYIYLQDIENVSYISQFQDYASILAGALLAWIVELLVHIILVWERLILPDN